MNQTIYCLFFGDISTCEKFYCIYYTVVSHTTFCHIICFPVIFASSVIDNEMQPLIVVSLEFLMTVLGRNYL